MKTESSADSVISSWLKELNIFGLDKMITLMTMSRKREEGGFTLTVAGWGGEQGDPLIIICSPISLFSSSNNYEMTVVDGVGHSVRSGNLRNN